MINNSNYSTNSCIKMKLSICSLAFAFGITKGLGMMLLAWSAWQWGVGGGLVTVIESIYHGYAPTLQGGLFGLAWGFLDGFVCGLVIAIIYNLCLCCCWCKACKKDQRP
jgi:hypothetical protein